MDHEHTVAAIKSIKAKIEATVIAFAGQPNNSSTRAKLSDHLFHTICGMIHDRSVHAFSCEVTPEQVIVNVNFGGDVIPCTALLTTILAYDRTDRHPAASHPGTTACDVKSVTNTKADPD